MKIGDAVKLYRDEHGLTQKEFAERCGISSSAIISFLERGFRDNGKRYLPKFDTIIKISKGLGMPLSEMASKFEDFDLDITVGPEEIPIYADYINELNKQPPDEAMLIQAYRMIPAQNRMEAMQAIFAIKDKYTK